MYAYLHMDVNALLNNHALHDVLNLSVQIRLHLQLYVLVFLATATAGRAARFASDSIRFSRDSRNSANKASRRSLDSLNDLLDLILASHLSNK